MWDVRRRRDGRALQTPAGKMTAFAATSDGKTIALAGEDGSVNIYRSAEPLYTANK